MCFLYRPALQLVSVPVEALARRAIDAALSEASSSEMAGLSLHAYRSAPTHAGRRLLEAYNEILTSMVAAVRSTPDSAVAKWGLPLPEVSELAPSRVCAQYTCILACTPSGPADADRACNVHACACMGRCGIQDVLWVSHVLHAR